MSTNRFTEKTVEKNLSPVEKIKKESRGLRGSIVSGLADELQVPSVKMSGRH